MRFRKILVGAHECRPINEKADDRVQIKAVIAGSGGEALR